MFVSVDPQEGNAQGVNPYAYVRGNPETWTDPTGERVIGCQPGTEGCSPTGTPGSKSGNPTINDCEADPTLGGCSIYGNPCKLSGGNPEYCGNNGSSDGGTTKQHRGMKKPTKKPWCLLVCGGVKSWWQFAKGALGFLGNSAALSILIAAFTGADATTDGAATFLANFVVSIGANLIRNMIDGIRGMIDSFVEHNPVLDIVADILEIGLDIVGLGSGANAFKNIKVAGKIGSAEQIGRLFNAVGAIFSGKPVDFAKYVGPAVSSILGITTMIASGTLLGMDVLQLGSDFFDEYQSYAADHDPSAGWNL